MYCHQCGKEVSSEVKYCPYCGAALDQQATQQTQYQNGGYQPIHQQPPYYGNNDDAPNPGFAILSFFIPIVGLILYLVWNKDYPLKAKSCLKGLITGVVMYFVFICCIFAAIGSIASESYNDYDDSFDWHHNAVVETVPYESID